MLAKAATLAADQVFLDLEDAVSPLEKVDARDRVVDALRTHDYSGKTRVVRVNGVTTRWCLGDVTAVVGGAGDRLDCIMVPKVEDAGQLHFIDHLLTQLETEHELPNRIGIEAQIENARGAMNIREIAQATPRLETLIFGPGDYAANMGVGQLVIGSISPEYPGDQWHWVLSQIVTAARAYGVQAIDGPYTDIKDTDGYRRMCRRARLIGYDGKWVLHPAQVEIANEEFSPSQAEFDEARRLLDAYEHATQVERKGAVMHEGQMIDEASRKIAEQVVARGAAAGHGAERGRPMSLPLEGLTDEQREIVELVRQFTDEQIIPVASQLEHDDVFPDDIVEGLKELGIFGFTIPEEHGGLGLDLTTYALSVCELARGWMSISGIINTHFIVANMLMRDGTDEQKERFLPRMATGEIRCAFSMTEPECGSDVQAIRTRAVRDGDDYVVNGQKMWVTNGLRSGLVATLVKTDPEAKPAHRGMSCLLVEKEPGVAQSGGLTVPPQLEKLGYKGVETTELVFADHRVPAADLLGGAEGQGFQQMMSGVEVGRVNVAARGVGVAQRAFELAIRYAQEREAFGKPIAKHQGIQFKLAEMATKIEAARLLMLSAARKKDAGERSDVEAGMAKLYASEICHEVVEDSFRIHGGYGYSKEYEIERLYRDAPMLLIGEGTSEIQKLIVARGLLGRYAI